MQGGEGKLDRQNAKKVSGRYHPCRIGGGGTQTVDLILPPDI